MGGVEEGKLYVYTPREDCSLTSLPGTGSGPLLLTLFTRERGFLSNLITREWPPSLKPT